MAFISPFIFHIPVQYLLAVFLQSDHVQSINFRFGHVHVFPSHFRAVADAILDGTLKVAYDPVGLAADGSLAEYDSGTNTFKFQNRQILSTPAGRATAVHEASHAVADFRNGDTAIRHEEGAAHICEGWYLLNSGGSTGGLPSNVAAAAAAMRARAAHGTPVHATGSEINSVRRDMARLGYENAFYDNDGF